MKIFFKETNVVRGRKILNCILDPGALIFLFFHNFSLIKYLSLYETTWGTTVRNIQIRRIIQRLVASRYIYQQFIYSLISNKSSKFAPKGLAIWQIQDWTSTRDFRLSYTVRSRFAAITCSSLLFSKNSTIESSQNQWSRNTLGIGKFLAVSTRSLFMDLFYNLSPYL